MRTLLSFIVAAVAFCITPAGQDLDFIPSAYAANCVAKENLEEKAFSFISRCRKGSIQREFPGELKEESLGTIKNGSSAIHKKAWKLLNDNRFAK